MMRLIACLLMLLLSGPTLAIETPDFEVIGEIEEEVQIRQYDRFTLAKVARGDVENGSDNQLFRPLADYIFGNNVREEKIAMTAPVAQTMVGSQAQDMAFFLPKALANPPQPKNKDISLIAGEMIVAVLRYRGGWSVNKFENAKLELQRKLSNQKEWRVVGDPIWARYNSPFSVPAFRTNEVMIPVEKNRES